MANTSGLKRGGTNGRPKGSLNKVTIEARVLAQRIVQDPAYRTQLRRRVQAGEAPHMETLLWHYAFGKPKESVEISTDGALVAFTLLPGVVRDDATS